MKKITVKEAAAQLSMTPLTLRILMQQEKLPIGYAIKRQGRENFRYLIYQELVEGFKERVESGGM